MFKQLIIILSLFSSNTFAQFTEIPNSSESNIIEINCNGNTCIAIDNRNKMFITNDNGQSFEEKIVPIEQGENKVVFRYPFENTLFFLVKSVGFQFPHRVIRSTDLGETWETIYDTTGSYFAFDVVNDSTYIVGGSQSKLFRTSNYGQSWESLSLGGSSIIYRDIKIFHDTLGVFGKFQAISRSSNIGESMDGGEGIGNLSPYKVYFVNAQKILFTAISGVGPGGPIYKSEDGGFNWDKVQNGGYQVYGIDFVSESEGYVTGWSFASEKGVILKTIDGGDSWSEIPTDFEELLISIRFMNDSLALIGGENGLLLLWNKNEMTTSIEDVLSHQNKVQIFPNPTNENLNIIFENELLDSNISFTILNLLGQTIYREQLFSSNKKIKHQIKTNHYSNGTYFLILRNGKQIVSKKFILQQ